MNEIIAYHVIVSHQLQLSDKSKTLKIHTHSYISVYTLHLNT